MQKIFFYVICLAILKVYCVAGQMTVGGVENVYVSSMNTTQQARIDTGATLTSIHAIDVVEFEKNDQKWVKFKIEDDNHFVEKSLPIIKIIHIKRGVGYKKQKRYVVKMNITLGALTKEVKVSLNDRTNMKYPILIGRNFLKRDIIVDVSQKFIIKQRKNEKNIYKKTNDKWYKCYNKQ